jgi:membrane protein
MGTMDGAAEGDLAFRGAFRMTTERPERPRHHQLPYRFREFSRRLWDKAEEDDVFFMAGAVAFNVIIAVIPLLILGVGLTGFVLSARFPDPTAAVLELGSIFFIWLATRLVGSLRIAVREVFDIGARRSIIRGKLFDIAAVLIGILLLTLNLGMTVMLTAAVQMGGDFLEVEGGTLSLADRLAGITVAVVSIWMLFLIAYRYLPARPIRWRTAAIAATFAAAAHEGLKVAFSWYATEVADYGSTLGNLATVAVLFFWIYYGALVFVLGGEVAQVSTMRKASRVGVVSFEAGP